MVTDLIFLKVDFFLVPKFTDLMPGETINRMEMATAWGIQTTMICCGMIFLAGTIPIPNYSLDSCAKNKRM